MTNEEKYKTPVERIKAFEEYCGWSKDRCNTCRMQVHCNESKAKAALMWLSFDSETVLPCPFCGKEPIVVPDYGGTYIRCWDRDCYKGPLCRSRDEAIERHNAMARLVAKDRAERKDMTK